MANKKISQLTAVTTLTNNDVFPVVQGTATFKAKISDIKSYLPTASSTVTGLLSNTDWTTFNNKQNALTLGSLTESTSSVLTITGGTSSVIGSGVTIQVKQASGSQSGFLSSTDWTTFNSKMSSLILTTTGTSGAATLAGSTLNIPQYLGAAVTSLGGQTGATQTFSTDNTGTDFTISSAANNHKFSIPDSSATARGLLTSSDWTTFNNKENAVSWGNLTESTSSVLTITGGTNAVRGSVTIQVKQAGASQSGFLSSGDWSTFNSKQGSITLTTTGSSGAATLINNVLNIPQYSGGGGISTLNTLTASTQTFATGTSGTDFNISSSTSTHTFNIPTASASNRGLLSTTDWTNFNNKGNGTVTSVGLTTGTSGTDVNVSGSPVTGSSSITLNIPDASATARGLITTGTQTLAGSKTFSSAPTFSTMTAGSILFAGTSGLVSQKNANLFWDNTNNRLGIGTNSPNDIFQIVSNSNFYPNFRNNATGLNSEISFYFQTYDGTTVSPNGGFGATSSNYNFSDFKPNSQYFVADRDGGLGLFAKHASGVIRMYTAGTDSTNRRFSIFNGGNVLIQSGGTHTDAGFRLDINGTCRHQGNTTFSDATNLILGTSTGNKIGTATSQKIGFWNATPIVQPTTAVAGATRVGGAGTTVTDTDTFDGYTIAQVVKALRNSGLLA